MPRERCLGFQPFFGILYSILAYILLNNFFMATTSILAEKGTAPRSIHWFEHTRRSISSQFPNTRPNDGYLVERLSALFLERLPPEVAQGVLALLPEGSIVEHYNHLTVSANAPTNSSIGYPDFIEKTAQVLGISEKPIEWLHEALPRKIADFFLWTVVQDFPAELKSRIIENLPLELKSRMNLYAAFAEEAKVA